MIAKDIVTTSLMIVTGLVLPTATANDIHVLVRSEVSGTEIIYQYELVNHSQGKMMNFSIGVIPADSSQDPQEETSVGEFTRLPTGTVWEEAPTMSLEYPDFPHPAAGWKIPVPGPTSVTSPPGWRAEVGGALRGDTKSPEGIARERYAITWYAPKPVYRGPVNVTGADAGQRLTGFSVRVPRDSTTGPGAVGSLTNYTNGHFMAKLWFGSSWIGKTQEIRRGVIEPPANFSVATNNNVIVRPGAPATFTFGITPQTDQDVISDVRLESITSGGTNVPAGNLVGAIFGTDVRTFQIVAGAQAGVTTNYIVTYSAASTTGWRSAVSVSVSITTILIKAGPVRPF